MAGAGARSLVIAGATMRRASPSSQLDHGSNRGLGSMEGGGSMGDPEAASGSPFIPGTPKKVPLQEKSHAKDALFLYIPTWAFGCDAASSWCSAVSAVNLCPMS